MESTTNTKWFVSVITHNDRRIGSSDLEFNTHSMARRWCQGEKVRGHPINGYITDLNTKEFRISRLLEIFDDDVETIQLG